jgi:hypothetical protein
MRSTKRQLTLGLLAGLAGLGFATSSSAQTVPAAVVLNTALTLGFHAPNGNTPAKRRDGAGVMDTTVAFDQATGDVFAFWTNSVPWGGNTGLNTGMQAAMAITKMTATGLATPVVKMLPNQGKNAQRVFMRPNALLGKEFVAVVFADEDDGNQNGNPQSVIWVYDRQGNQLNITNAGDVGQKPTDPVNLISLFGNNDGQQQCPHSFCKLPDGADGTQSWIMGQQYNNQEARVMRVDILPDGNGGAQVKVPYIKTIVQNARHNRVQLACNPNGGVGSDNTIVATSVEADDQPYTYGVRAVLVDTNTGNKISSTLVAPSDSNAKLYMVQPTAQYISPGVVALEYQTTAPVRHFSVNDTNGHTGSGNESNLMTLKVPTTPGADFTVIQKAQGISPYGRHSEAFGLKYGPVGSEMTGVAAIGGASEGTGPGLIQVMPIRADGTFDPPDPMKTYQVSQFSDVAGLPARTKRDNDQSRGFIHGVYGIVNPSYQKTGGFMPEVATFNLSAVAGYANINTDNRESLTFALVPATWDPSVTTTPGVATPNVPPGPSPAAPSGTPATNPSAPSAGTGAGGQTGSSSGGTGGGVRAPGFGGSSASSGGCTTASVGHTSDLAGFATLGLGFALFGLRRRGNKKES